MTTATPSVYRMELDPIEPLGVAVHFVKCVDCAHTWRFHPGDFAAFCSVWAECNPAHQLRVCGEFKGLRDDNQV